MGGNIRILRASLAVVLLVGLFWLLFVGILANQANRSSRGTIPSTRILKPLKLVKIKRFAVYQDLDIHVVSKRRVPSGPDPIHNRRVSTSRQPPGRE